MLTEIPVPRYAKDLCTLSAILRKADTTALHSGSCPPAPAEDLSPDVTTKLSVIGQFLAAPFFQSAGVTRPKDNLNLHVGFVGGACSSPPPPLISWLLEVIRVPTCEELCRLPCDLPSEGAGSEGCSRVGQGWPGGREGNPAAPVPLGTKVG